jgi:hypothetical protein
MLREKKHRKETAEERTGDFLDSSVDRSILDSSIFFRRRKYQLMHILLDIACRSSAFTSIFLLFIFLLQIEALLIL